MDESRGPLNVGKEAERAPLTEPSRQPLTVPEAKLKAIRKAAEYSFPTVDIQQMLAEIERGRGR
ncbi:MAG: hypothetical protein AAB654_06050 [Acidobacteriota bacterium]